MDILKIILQVILVITSLANVMLVLMHKGKGGGLSDMFGGGMTASVGSSGVAERNLNRLTVGFVVVWVLTIVALGLIAKL
ncbi:preprotein translocase subunit SecG [Sanguibacter sp. HDW7]|uniref:preprotein translocase subunit SecG n=1 Tax=Sanguibacter sp. HDW7 TaxID=2714931 RepID=UPI0014082A41|nr:preprotein translocase subunit SecG [Sanguibacter sp. HDW7]QIK83471.1 preprotein translocase subunit SecG [Sanguibacter sp. HDW7]